MIMEPMKGGILSAELPPDIAAKLDAAKPGRTPVDWAFAWLYNFPEVVCVLSGMSNLEQVKENIAIASAAGVGDMSPAELAALEDAAEAIKRNTKIPCTFCAYCLICPQKLDIPTVFKSYNYANLHNDFDSKFSAYWQLPEDKRASACTGCKKCLALCPQKLPIDEHMSMIAEKAASL